ncbi:MAG: hypothetical protein ACM30E_07725, partial [Nitrososphaerales archaeon]
TLSVLQRQGAEALGDLDLDEYVSPSVTPAKFRDRRLVLVVAPVSEVEPATVTCGICGFVLMAETTAPGGALQARYVHTNLLNGCGFKLAVPVRSGAAGS